METANNLGPRYTEFLASRVPKAGAVGFKPEALRPCLDGFRAFAAEACIRRGRSALFLDTGLGKTTIELEFAAQCAERTGKPSVILTPLAVARQMEREAKRFGYPAQVIREQTDLTAPIAICNYDRLDRIDVSAFGAIVLDESSVLKAFDGKTTRALISAFADTPYRLAATATPAPNDHVELGTHAEFLGVMTRAEMLARWFINDTSEASQTWRLKKHAVTAFWDWCASWAVMAERPEDLGFDGAAFVLPEMQIIRHKTDAGIAPTDGLFGFNTSATGIFDVKRQTADARAEAVARIVRAEPDEAWVVWCDTDGEADALLKRLPDDFVDVRGSMQADRKEDALEQFATQAVRGICTKPSIAGAGLNFQFCARMAFVGRSFSYESWYQAVRRCWRFGQTRNLQVHLIVAEGEDQIGRVLNRKSESHAIMKAAMRDAQRRNVGQASATKIAYNPTHTGSLPAWLSAA
nr:helicase-related protein [uncultured Lichenicoccus sp.]